jgi:hypothetical protein
VHHAIENSGEDIIAGGAAATALSTLVDTSATNPERTISAVLLATLSSDPETHEALARLKVAGRPFAQNLLELTRQAR